MLLTEAVLQGFVCWKKSLKGYSFAVSQDPLLVVILQLC